MNTSANADDIPFVNEECGDTMWDMDLLDQLNETTTNQLPTPSVISPKKTFSPGQTLRGDGSMNDTPGID